MSKPVLKLGLSAFALALGITFGMSFGGAEAQTVPTKLVHADQINAQLSKSGSAHVIVLLANDAEIRDFTNRLSNKADRANAVADIRRRVDTAVRDFYPSGRNSRGREIKVFDILPGFATEVTAAEFVRMQADARIFRIENDEIKTINLNSSVPLIGIPVSSTADADAAPNGTGRTVAVIDTGVQADHPFIGSGRVLAEACFVTTATCPNGSTAQVGAGASAPASGQSHGTHVSGIILGHYASGASVTRGVASKANLVMVNVFGSGSGAYTSDIIRGLDFIDKLKTVGYSPYGKNANIDAVNMSLGGGSYSGACDSDAAKPVIDLLRSDGVLSVIAAGNDGSKAAMSSPGCISSAISVAATSKTAKVISSYSNISSVTTVFAPGGESGGCVISSVPGSAYGSMCGTSMATPHVAGEVALLREAQPNATSDAIVAALTTNMQMVKDTRTGGTISKPFVDVPTAIGNILNQKFNLVTINLVQGTGVGTRSGKITSSIGGFTCSASSCTGSFVVGSTVTLTALADTQSKFSSWSIPNESCPASACTITIPDAATMTASVTFDSSIISLVDGIDNPPISLTNLDNAAWYGVASPAKSSDNTDAGRSGVVLDNQKSSMQATIAGPGTLKFYWAVSSEASYDFLRFYVDGVEQSGSISGSVGYSGTPKSFAIQCGSHTVKWSYTKDVSVSSGDDAGYVDRVTYTAGSGCYTLSVSKNVASYGTVTSTSPSGISCGSTCSASFASGTVVTLKASTSGGRKFTGWSGACSGTSTTCNVTMNGIKSVVANYR